MKRTELVRRGMRAVVVLVWAWLAAVAAGQEEGGPAAEKAGPQEQAGQTGDYRIFDPLVDVCDLIHRNYVVETDDKELVTGAINGMLHELDFYSEYIPAPEVEAFQKQTSGSYEGIGIGIDSKEGNLIVISPFEDSPAYKAGVQAGDMILEVNGQETKGWSNTKAVKEMTGEAGSEVKIKVRHADGEEEDIVIVRERIQVPTIKGWRREAAGGWDYMLDEESKVGYVRLTQFVEETAGELDAAMEKLQQQKMEALILDLRSNPGGLMSAAVEIVDRMIDHGVIVSTRGAHTAPQEQTAQAQGTYPRFHLVILIDQGSASAAEIVSGSLQDHGRAVVVGQRSWGKGSVQRVFRLPDSGDAVKITTDYYYLPKGRCVHRLPGSDTWGVDPDVEEKLDPTKFEELRDLLEELMRQPAAKEKKEAETGGEDKAKEAAAKKALAERLLELDGQLAQGLKQCKGLIRSRPGLQPLGTAGD